MAEYISKESVLSKCDDMWNAADETTQTGVDTINTIDEITDFIESLPTVDVQPVNQWISVKDRLPDENQKCLVYRNINADLKITTGIWHSDWKEFYGLRHGTRLEDTIAWMPLPEPPKDGDI